eukprot:CAMPEP_0168595512 /NCGR_PEP_ID=MMETSP0420-20121227/9507_1 /TAXON_ID=498008 /ORGANISM="Pessonella sp." /LENGTH=258 /DNA_ID=CAMNT_0008631975 /DNA_START=79 /DNA_END=855 /DNA_ORIENTATION=+
MPTPTVPSPTTSTLNLPTTTTKFSTTTIEITSTTRSLDATQSNIVSNHITTLSSTTTTIDSSLLSKSTTVNIDGSSISDSNSEQTSTDRALSALTQTPLTTINNNNNNNNQQEESGISSTTWIVIGVVVCVLLCLALILGLLLRRRQPDDNELPDLNSTEVDESYFEIDDDNDEDVMRSVNTLSDTPVIYGTSPIAALNVSTNQVYAAPGPLYAPVPTALGSSTITSKDMFGTVPSINESGHLPIYLVDGESIIYDEF